MAELGYRFILSLRDIEKIILVVALYYASIFQGSLDIKTLIPFLAYLKVKQPEIYEKIKMKKIPHESLIGELKIGAIQEGTIMWDLINWLQFCLLPDDEYNKLDNNSELKKLRSHLFDYSINRNSIIPLFCENIDNFKIIGM